MTSEKMTMTKKELETMALHLYCEAMKLWIANNGGNVKALDSSIPPPPPPPPPHG